MSKKKKDSVPSVPADCVYEKLPLHPCTLDHFPDAVAYVTDPAFPLDDMMLPYGNLSEDDFQPMEIGISKTRDPQPMVASVGPIRWDFHMKENGEFAPTENTAETEETGANMDNKKKDERIKEVLHLLEAPLKGFDLRQIYHEALSIDRLYEHRQKKYRHDHDDTQYGTIRMPTKLVLAMLQNITDFRRGMEHGFVIAEPKVSDGDFKVALEKAFEDDGSPFGGRVVVREGITVKPSKPLPNIPESLQDFASDLCAYERENDALKVQFTFHDDIVKGDPRNSDRGAFLNVRFGSTKKNGTERDSYEVPVRYVRIVKQDGKHYARFQCVNQYDSAKIKKLHKQNTFIHASLHLYAGSSKKYHIDQSTPLLLFRDRSCMDLYLHANGGAASTHKRPERMAVRVDNRKERTSPRDDLPPWMCPLYRHINERHPVTVSAGTSKYYVPATRDYLRLYFGPTQIKGITEVNLLTDTEVPTIQVLIDRGRSYSNRGTYCTKRGHSDRMVFRFRDYQDVKYQAKVKSSDIRIPSSTSVGEILFEVEGVLNWTPEEKPVRVPPIPEFIKPFEGLIESYIDPYCCAWESIDPTVGTLTFNDQSFQRIEKVLYMETENSERGTVRQMRIVCLPPQKTVLKKGHTSSLNFKTARGTIHYTAEVLDSRYKSGKVESTFQLHTFSQSYYSGMVSV